MLDGTIPENGSQTKLGDLLGGAQVRLRPPADPQQKPSAFACLVDDCVAAGLLEAVLPVVPAKAQTEPHLAKNRGKIPGEHIGGDRWRGFVGWTKHVTSKADIEKWRRWPDAGLCIRTAVLPSLDIDIEDTTIAVALDKLVRLRVGPGVLVRTRGSSPRRAFLFRVDGPVWKRRMSFHLPDDARLHAVDLLGIGQQLVLAGEHPSGARYELEAPGLSGVTFGDIPELSIAQLDELWDEIGKTIADAGGRAIEMQSRSAREQPERKLGPADAVMREIMRQRERWVPSLLAWGPGAAEKEWRIDPDALDRSELEEDLVVYRDGIYDFGTERWHDPLSLIREFGAVAPDGAIEFGGSPDYGPRDGRPFAVVGESDSSVRRPTEGEATGWLSRCLGGPALPSSVTRAEALPVLACAVGLDWLELDASQAAEWFDADAAAAAAAAPASEPALVGQGVPGGHVARMPVAITARPDPADIPVRRWLVEPLLPVGDVAQVVGEPGANKSTFTLLVALAVATGDSRLLEGDAQNSPIKLRGAGPVLVYNAEDSLDEMHRRLAASMSHYRLHHLAHPITLWSGLDHSEIEIMKRGRGVNAPIEPAPSAKTLEAYIKGAGVRLVVLDPQVSLSRGLAENNTDDMNALVQEIARMASRLEISILLVHHTTKQARNKPGDMGAARGAFAQAGKFRSMTTLTAASDEDAAEMGARPGDVVCLSFSKVNHGRKPSDPVHFRRLSIAVGNGRLAAMTAADHFNSDPVLAGDYAPVLEIIGKQPSQALAERHFEDANRPQKIGQSLIAALDGRATARLTDILSSVQSQFFLRRISKSKDRSFLTDMIRRDVGSGLEVEMNGQIVRVSMSKDGAGPKAPWVVSVCHLRGASTAAGHFDASDQTDASLDLFA